MNNLIKFLLTASTLSAAICSCNKNHQSAAGANLNHGNEAEISIRVTTGASKASVRSDSTDKAVSNLTIFVFNTDEFTENICSGSIDKNGVFSQKIRSSIGEHTIWAVANASETMLALFPDISCLSDLKELSTTLDQENAHDSFLMTACEECYTLKAGENVIPLALKRLVARLEIHKITNGISPETDNLLAGYDFTVDEIFILNAPAQRSLYEETVTQWYNCGQKDPDAGDLLCDSGIDVTLQKDSSYTQSHYFYCYPNSETASYVLNAWSPCKTQLVIGAIAGEQEEKMYYSIELPDTGKSPSVTGLEANKTYSINSCTITRRGTDSPGEKVEVGSISLNITVTDWVTGASYDYTI